MSQFYFAWVDAGTAWSSALEVEDEEVVAFSVEQSEGDFATLSIDVRNPRVGLLGPGRKIWAWFAVEMGSVVTPLFFGRIVGAPEKMNMEIVRLLFVARPEDFQAQKEALAETLRVAPYYDPVWLAVERRDEADAVLDARSQVWHIDRTTHEVTVSDIISGEDGGFTFGEGTVLSVDMSLGEAPVRRVEVNAEVAWQQSATGKVEIKDKIVKAFHQAGSTGIDLISSYTGEGLQDDWPEAGADIGGGWSVRKTKLVRADGNYLNPTFTGGVVSDNSLPGYTGLATYLSEIQQFLANFGLPAGPVPGVAYFPLWKFRVATFKVQYVIDRTITEHVKFTLEADCQPLLTEPGDEEVIKLTLAAGSAVSDPLVDEQGTFASPPIGDVRRSAYLTTDRGKQSFEYLIALARAQLLARSRAVTITFEVPLATALDVTLRQNATLNDSHLPGGTATGKVVHYAMTGGGDGQFKAAIAISCAIGNGGAAPAPSDGTPDYADAGYAEPTYQTYSGQVLATAADDVTYTNFQPVDTNLDSIDFTSTLKDDDVVDSCQVFGGETEQAAIITAGGNDAAAITEALNQIFTEVDLVMVPFEPGPFDTYYEPTVGQLMVPMLIDLGSS